MRASLHARGIRYFDAIRRCGSIREAARRLHVSSSAVNRQLLQLEAEVGEPLFERLPRGMQLTPAGEVFARHVINVLQDAERMAGELDSLRGLRRGSVDVIAVEALSSAFLPAVLQEMNRRYPAVRISIRMMESHAAGVAVAAGEADVALAFLRQKIASLRQVAVGRFFAGAIVPPGHPLAVAAHVTGAQLTPFPLVLPGPGLSFFPEIHAAVTRNRRQPEVVLETGSLTLMRELVRRGVGIAVMNRFGIEREVDEGALRFIPVRPGIASDLGAYVRSERSLPPAVDAFTQVVRAEIEAALAAA
ncbi:MAG TPA: LysR family transcriptional regulator [Ramlibacter sp.]|nr:LysR family transcriptional regulator [Ramlibacter sp.]